MPPKTSKAGRPTGQRLALLICNSTYVNGPQLAGVAKDAVSLGAVLSDRETCRFTLQTLVDRGLLEVRREIAKLCAEVGEEDTLLIYYTGNGGLGLDGSFYLTVADTDAEYLPATSLDANFVLEHLRRTPCRRIILLVDACHAGAFFENNRGIPNGLYAITSCAANQSTTDTPQGGAFTMAVCAGLRTAAADSDGDGLVSIDDLHEFVKRHLRAQGCSSTPQKWVWNVPEAIYMTAVPRHVFLSYAREDVGEARKLACALESEGLPVWIDLEGIRSGNWRMRVTEGLNRSRAVVMVLTKNSLNSEAVRKELGFAAKKQVPIIPVQLGKLAEASLPDWFTLDYDELHRPHLDPHRYEEGLKELATAIRTLKQKERPWSANDGGEPAELGAEAGQPRRTTRRARSTSARPTG
jgi:hypothetical protein